MVKKRTKIAVSEVIEAMPMAAAAEPLSITKEDFVNIAVAHREEQLIEEVTNGKTELRKMEKQRWRILEALRINIEKSQEAKYSEAIKAADEIYPRDPLMGNMCSDEEIEVRMENGDKTLIRPHIYSFVDLYAEKRGEGICRAFVEAEFNEEQQKMVDEIVELDKRREALEKKIKDSKKLRKEIPHLERKAKAALSVHVLKQSEKGKAVLSALEDLTSRKLSLDLKPEPKKIL